MKENFTHERDKFITALIENHYPSLMLFTTGCLRKYKVSELSPEDILQEVHLTILTKHKLVVKQYEQHGIKYINTIIKNEILNGIRQKKNRLRRYEIFHEKHPITANIFTLCTDIYNSDMMGELSKLLSSQDWDVMRLYIMGYSYDEISEMTGIKQNTIGSKISRSKKKLTRYFGRNQ